ncbi:DUF3224 domain-containing protein [Salinimonas sp. HHU 13199]|uniref:DUF3224 domain-containing protein n=2 Tax=Salinimonas profundi TaxID=2729140 RepID=A0ABR8LEG8_9ALTE|nr:DUF3224 domain-containing protein [Salinimonas profundi]
MQKATGQFTVNILPQQDAIGAGRMIIEKDYEGELQGVGKGQMLSKQVDGGMSVYCAIEEFEGHLAGKSGGFTLLHQGKMSSESRELSVTVIQGSGSGELASLTGSMQINQDENSHTYIFEYSL